MIKKVILSILLLVFIMIILIFIGLHPSSNARQEAHAYISQLEAWSDPYPYSIYKQELCQIVPEDIDDMDTELLLEIVLLYPYLQTAVIPSFERGVQYVSSTFNGLEALMQRPDLMDVAYHRYAATPVQSSAAHEENGDSWAAIEFLNHLCMFYEMLDIAVSDELHEKLDKLTEEKSRTRQALYDADPDGYYLKQIVPATYFW